MDSNSSIKQYKYVDSKQNLHTDTSDPHVINASLAVLSLVNGKLLVRRSQTTGSSDRVTSSCSHWDVAHKEQVSGFFFSPPGC